MNAPTDDELIAHAAAGNAEALREIVARHRKAVYGYLRARIVNGSDVERLMHDVFATLATDGSPRAAETGVRARLIEIARNAVSDYARRAGIQDQTNWTALCLDLDDPANADDGEQRLARLQVGLEMLEPSARQAIEQKYGADRSSAEIGTRLRRSESAVRSLLVRARQALQQTGAP